MFKSLEKKWNAHTPVYLHNRTKENFIFQIILAAVLIGAITLHEEWKDRRDFPEMYQNKKNRRK